MALWELNENGYFKEARKCERALKKVSKELERRRHILNGLNRKINGERWATL